MTQQQFFESLQNSFNKCLEISKKKNADYTGSIDPFANFRNSLVVGVPIERGILVRIMDKISRISTLLDKEAKVADEKLEDTLLDLCNYAAILKAYLDSKKVL